MSSSLLLGRLANRLVGSDFFAAPTLLRLAAQPARRTFITTPRLGLPTKPDTVSAPRSKATKAAKPAAIPEKKASKKRVVGKKKPSPTKKPGPKKNPVAASKKPATLTITPEMKPPKRSPTSYLLFFQQYITQHPKVQSIEEMSGFIKTVAAAWHALSDAEKQPYVEQAIRQRVEYEKKRAEWFAKVDPAVLRELNKRRGAKGKPRILRPRDPTRPKIPLSGYMTFATEFRRAAEPGTPMVEIARQAGAAWGALSVAERAGYNASAITARAHWEAENRSES